MVWPVWKTHPWLSTSPSLLKKDEKHPSFIERTLKSWFLRVNVLKRRLIVDTHSLMHLLFLTKMPCCQRLLLFSPHSSQLLCHWPAKLQWSTLMKRNKHVLNNYRFTIKTPKQLQYVSYCVEYGAKHQRKRKRVAQKHLIWPLT